MFFYGDGGSSSSTQSANNTIVFNPIISKGNANSSKVTSTQESRTSASALTKEQSGLSAGVAIGGSSAQGGVIRRNASNINSTSGVKISTFDMSVIVGSILTIVFIASA